jgi:hypothetical protein
MDSFFDNAAVHEFVIIGGQLCTAASATHQETIVKEINSKKKSRTRESPA